MRGRGVWFSVLLLLCWPALVAAAGGQATTLTYYSGGRFVTEAIAQLRAREQRGVTGGHQPWRLEPALVAGSEARNLRPPDLPNGEEDRRAEGRLVASFRTAGGPAEYTVEQVADGRAVVALTLGGRLTHRLTLGRPFGRWWYITGVTDAGGKVTAPPLRVEQLWRAHAPAAARAMPIPTGLAVADDGTAVVTNGKYPGTLYSLNGDSGRVQCRRTARWFYAGLDIDAEGQHVVAAEVVGGKPNTDYTVQRLLLLDRRGKVQWRRSGHGGVEFWPDGRYLLSYNRVNDFGVRLYRSRDGRLLWQVRPSAAGQMERASFSLDGRYVLVQAANRVSLYTMSGNRVWSQPFPHGVTSASTTRDGSVTAVSTDGEAPELVLLDRSGAISARRGAPTVSLPNAPRWQDAVMLPNGGAVAGWAFGGSAAEAVVQTVNLEGVTVWSRAVPTYGGSPSLHVLPEGTLALANIADSGMIIWFLNPSWSAPQGLQVTGKVSDWRLSPDGSRLVALVGSQVQEFTIH